MISNSTPLKIILLIRSLDIGGTEIQLVNLAGGLRNRGINLRVAVFYANGPLQSKLEAMGVTVVSLNKRGRWDFVFFGYRFMRLVFSFQPNVIYSFLTGANLCAVIGKLAYPNAKIFWGTRASSPDQILRSGDKFVDIAFRLSKQLSVIPKKIILNSRSSLDHHIKTGFDENKLIVIPNGIDVARYRYCPNDGRAVRSSLGIKQDDFLIGIVARLDPIKEHETFLRAARQFLNNHHGAKFLIVGSGEGNYESKLKRLANSMELGNSLLWIDEENDLPGIYNALNIHTLTSRSESLPNTVCEAMACGTPCVASDVGDCNLIIGDTGFIVNVGDVDGFVSAWETIYFKQLGSSYKKPCTDAIYRISTNYSLENMIEQTMALFNADCEMSTTHR